MANDFFTQESPAKPHLVRAKGGVAGEVWDLRGDIERAFDRVQDALAASSMDYVNVLHVGKHGDDANDGKTPSKAFETFGAALSAAVSGQTIVGVDGETYSERVTIPAGVNVFAPLAKVVGPGGGTISDGAVEINDGFVLFGEITAGAGESAVVKLDTVGQARFRADRINLPGPSMLGIYNFSLVNGGVLLADVYSVFCGQACVAVGSATVGTGHTHFFGEDIYLEGDNAGGIANGSGASVTEARVAHILKVGAVSNTTAINCGAGRINAHVLQINADVAVNKGAGTTTRLDCDDLTGTIVGAGTLRQPTWAVVP